MGLRIEVFLLCFCFQLLIIAAETNDKDAAVLQALKSAWSGLPPNWLGSDPCGDKWEGIDCTNSRVTSISLSSMGLEGKLSGDITFLSELQTLDLSFNKALQGSIPTSIGNLKKLTNLILVACDFSGPIPDSIGSLQQLVFLSLNSNSFTGQIPPSIGNLSKLLWLDLTDNQLEGPLPVSDGVSPGLDMLLNTKHFHLGKNKLSGDIPDELFSSNMTLIHVIFDSNGFTGTLPSSLGLVKTLEVMDMSNNSFGSSPVPSWFSTLPNLTRLVMEHTGLDGEVPADIFSLPKLRTVVLKHNKLSGTLDVGPNHSSPLQSINLQNNLISEFNDTPGVKEDITIILADNPICLELGEAKSYCRVPDKLSSYTTPPKNCQPPASCSSDQISSPTCVCAYPYTGTLKFVEPSFSGVGSKTDYDILDQSIMQHFRSNTLPVDSVSLSNPHRNSSQYFEISLAVFPSGLDRFNRTGISRIGNVFGNPTFAPPVEFGPYFFFGDDYWHFAGESIRSEKSSSSVIVIGAAAGGCVLLILLLAGVYAYHQKRIAEKANEQNPFAHWDLNKSSGTIPQLKGARCFSFEELNKYTNHFSEANDVGSGGYGKVYRGILPTGKLIAIKRAQQGSMQGGVEFKTEIELLSRVHHKNLVTLLGFCFEQGEQMLIYEYIANGSLRDSLSGKTGISLDWRRRLTLALGASRGIAYLHDHADPPIIHRDIKSTNILLDERLTAKVSDFGISKSRPMDESEKDHITTQVKGTMGYMDPEYYMTQQLTEKSDVYSFGVLMFELLTGKRPLERGKYIVREIRLAMDKTKDLYNLYEIVDPTIGLSTTLKGFEKFVDLALRCVEESGADRPTMGEVVKEIEYILQLAGLNPNTESTSTSSSYDDVSMWGSI